MESIRQLTEQELPLSSELINFAFKREGNMDEPLVNCNAEDIWGYFTDGELASNIIIIPLSVYIHGHVHGMGLIAGVASWPDFRKSGTIRKLMIHSLEVMRESGQTVSYLGPFSYPFYRRFGWEMMYVYNKYTLKASCLPDWQGNGSTRRIVPDIPLLNRIYERYAVRFNGMLERDEHRWKTSILKWKKGIVAVYFDAADEPRGYMIYQFQGSQLNVHELVYLDLDAQKGLWEYIRKQDSMFETVSFTAPSDDPFAFLIDNPKGLETKLITHLMARIIDVASFLEKFPFLSAANGQKLYISVTDEYAPWNNGSYEIAVAEDGSVRVHGTSNTADMGISCDIQTLSTMLMGYKTPMFLHELGRLQGDKEEAARWEAILPKQTPYYTDFGF